jgi:transcriptional regulator with XRE-family HTH domain
MDPIQMLLDLKGSKSLEYLATEIGCSRAYVSLVLTGKRPPAEKMLRYLGLERIQPMPIYRKRRK